MLKGRGETQDEKYEGRGGYDGSKRGEGGRREEKLAKHDTQVIIKSDKCHLDYL